MILTCPSCSAKFMISSEALGANGREVRCGKCGHMWFQEGERDSLDDLPRDEPDDFDIGFIPHVDQPIAEPPIPEALKPKPSVEESEKASGALRNIIAVGAAVIIVMVLFVTFISMRESLGHQYPFLGAAYEKMGLHLSKQNAQIAIDRLKLTKDGNKLQGSMYLINLTSDDVPVKKITADITDLDEKTLKSVDVKIPEKKIKGEGQSKVDFTFESVPKGSASVRVKLSER